jgi:hypothetical protein
VTAEAKKPAVPTQHGTEPKKAVSAKDANREAKPAKKPAPAKKKASPAKRKAAPKKPAAKKVAKRKR